MGIQQGSMINDQLSGKHVLVTGCTGFLGKVLLEKLLRSVPDIAGIHLLIRGSNKFNSVRERFESEIASSTIFNHMRSEDAAGFENLCNEKVHIVAGEITQPKFGMSDADYSVLANKIDMIVNSAASVNFREELDKAITINTMCLNNIIALSEAGNIPVVQVSTCYVHGFNTGDIYEETLAPAGRSFPRNNLGQYLVESTIEKLQKKISKVKEKAKSKAHLSKLLVDLGIEEAHKYGWNDTYTFTKWMGEQLLIEKLNKKSLAIVRPAIIESTMFGPQPGWIEGVKVADAIIFAYARGKIAMFPGDSNGVIDIIPADLVANSIILAMTKTFKDPGQMNIYQSCSSGTNPARIGQLRDYMVDEGTANYEAYPKLFKGKRPADYFPLAPQAAFDNALKAVQLPLDVAQRARSILGMEEQKWGFHKNIDTAAKLSTVFAFYSQPKYKFHNGKILALAEELGVAGESEFAVDPKLIDWKKYFGKTHIAGLEKYALIDKSSKPGLKQESAKVKSLFTEKAKSEIEEKKEIKAVG
ncbi:fatty acyl-CoA reductase [Litoribacillus peritrichatus]|uniref:Dehydrogenase n=1 Tax=Litoribacillus peritrichatus TaxID=718191 RepID=A0ABP7MC87_9GAMM